MLPSAQRTFKDSKTNFESAKILPLIHTLGPAVFRFDLIACASGLRGSGNPLLAQAREVCDNIYIISLGY